MNEYRNIALNLFTGTAGKLISTLIGVITFSLLSRYLGPGGFGHYQMVMAMLAILGVIANLGTSVIALRDISQSQADRDTVLGSAVALRAFASVLMLLTGPFVAYAMAMDDVVVYGTLLGIIGWSAIQVNEVVLTVFQYRLKQHLAVIADVSGVCITLILVVVFIYAKAGTIAMVGAMVGGNCVTLLVALLFARREVPFRLHFYPWAMFDLFRRGWPVGASLIVTTATMRLDMILLGSMTTTSEVGIYGMSFKIFQLTLVVPTLVAGFLMRPLMETGPGTGERGRAINDWFIVVFAGAFLLAIIFWYFGTELAVLIGGRAYGDAGASLQILGIAGVFALPVTFLRTVAVAVDRQKSMLRADIAGALIGVSLYGLLIPQLGAVGAAAGKLIAFFAVFALAAFSILKDIPKAALLRGVSKCLFAAVAAVLVVELLEGAVVHLLVRGFAASAVYLLALYLVGAFPPELVPFWARKKGTL